MTYVKIPKPTLINPAQSVQWWYQCAVRGSHVRLAVSQ